MGKFPISNVVTLEFMESSPFIVVIISVENWFSPSKEGLNLFLLEDSPCADVLEEKYETGWAKDCDKDPDTECRETECVFREDTFWTGDRDQFRREKEERHSETR